MSAVWPLSVMGVWAMLIIATMLQGSRLLRMFRDRYPQIAQREIPYVFDHWQHPEKAIFFFRKRAVEILRPDPRLWRERQRFVALTFITIGFWLACGVSIVILGMLLT